MAGQDESVPWNSAEQGAGAEQASKSQTGADSHSQHLSETIITPRLSDNDSADEAAANCEAASANTVPPPASPAQQPAAQSAEHSRAGKRIGRYVIEDVLGKGGFGKVYLAFDEMLQRKVAIKAPRLDVSVESVRDEFLIEARQLARLSHPGIVGVLDVLTKEERCYIVSEFVDGVGLSSWLRSERPSWQTSAEICAQIADALAHAHAQRTVHRDLKPANVILTAGNQPVIVDFGLSISDGQRAQGTGRGEISGTLHYMSPEQARGAGHRIDGRTDIYSLGVILYVMLTGRVPFDAPSVNEMIRQVEEDEPQPPRQLVRGLPAEVERICLKAMAKSLKERYTTSDDLADDLRQLLRGGSSGTTAPAVQGPAYDAPTASHIAPVPAPPTRIDPVPTRAHSPVEDLSLRTSLPMDSAIDFAEADVAPFDDSFVQPPATADVLDDSSISPGAESTQESQAGRSGRSGSVSGKSASGMSWRQQSSQRRQVTIVVCGCDVYENEDVQESLEPDEQVELLQSFQQFCTEAISEFNGSLLQETDDGIAVCFGFPVAFEDSVPQAVRFGREILNRMPAFNERLKRQKLKLSARVIAHTDVAVVEAKGGSENESSISVVGTIRNYISKLELVAEPDAMLVTDQTLKLTRGRFAAESLGEQRIRGIAGPVALHRITDESVGEASGIFTARQEQEPLIGRDREIELLKERWEQAAEGMGQVVLIIGEAGLGKSRLVQTLMQHVTDESPGDGISIIEWRSSEQRQNSSLYPAIDCFERILGFDRDDTPDTQLDKLVEHLRELNLDGDTEIALIASLLSIPLGGRYPELSLPPQQQHEQLDQLLLDWLKELSYVQPLLFVIEDLHWVDPSTLEFVEEFVDQGLNDSILTLLTFRPEFETPWGSKAHQTNLALNRLTKRQIQQMMEQRANRPLPQSVVDQIIERTDGVPLFVEEYTRMIIESGALRAQPGTDPSGSSSVSGNFAVKQIPASLQDMLMSRLDRIDCDQSVVQLGAVIGRTFSLDLIRAASTLPGNELQRQLERLVTAEILISQGRESRLRYQFKHALLQDAAYNSLVKAQRQAFHGRIAAALEAKFEDICQKEPEVLAQHFTAAEVPEKAVNYWQRAGERSRHRFAYREAIQQLRAGLSVLQDMPETRERHLQEIDLQISLGVPLQAILGYSHPEVEAAYARAFSLCQQLQLTDESFPTLYGLFRYYMLQGKYARAIEISRELLTLANGSQRPDFVVAANRAIASSLVYQGQYATAMPHLDQVLAIEATPQLRSQLGRYDVVDPWIAAGSYRAWTLWLTGFPQQALDQSVTTLAEAEALRHPFTKTLALSFGTWLYQFRRDVDATLAAAERALEISRDQSFQFWIGWGQVLRHWSLGISGRDPSACVAISEGIVAWRKQGSELGSSYFYAMLAEVALLQKNTTTADAALREAEEFAAATSEGFPLPDIYRLRGELALQTGNAEQAEQWFQKAIETARSQGARSYELRAAVSLARQWQSGDRQAEARDLLTGVLDQFHEGFETADLVEATNLKAELTAE